jgi:hypothetical protein
MNPIFYNLRTSGRGLLGGLLLWALCVLAPFHAFGQDDDEDDDQGTEFVYGINLNSNAGLIGGVIFRYSQPLSDRMYQHFSVELVNVKHPKEFRFQGGGNSFIYGKHNYLFALRPQYGRELVLFRKAPEEGVRINVLVAGGPSIGIIKPYFVELSLSTTQTSIVQYDLDNPAHDQGQILGSTGLLRFNGTQLAAGLHAKVGATFVFGNFRSSVTGFEVGALAEVYNRDIPIIKFSDVPNKQFFSSVYLNLFFGGRK